MWIMLMHLHVYSNADDEYHHHREPDLQGKEDYKKTNENDYKHRLYYVSYHNQNNHVDGAANV